jgi:transcriptional regulator with XRE-family HTH domain
MAEATTSVGPQIRAWRETRGLSQFELASRAGFSARHLSFIETGRASPSREAVLALGEVLGVPFREQNRLLEAAGFARVFRETPLSADQMAHMRGMLQFILDRHLPYPAIVVDRHWNALLSNEGTQRFFSPLTAPALASESNVLRSTFHPEGLRRWIVNWPEVERQLLRLAELELGTANDSTGAALLAELRSYAGAASRVDSHPAAHAGGPLLPMHFRIGQLDLHLFTTIMTLGTPQDITLQELRIETFFPADQDSERCWRLHFAAESLPPATSSAP